MAASAVWLILSTLIQVSVSSLCAVWPLWAAVPKVLAPTSLWKIYSLADSNIDVWAASIANSVTILALLYLAGSATPRRGTSFRQGVSDATRKARRGIYTVSILYQLLLLGKAVSVAILGRDNILPKDPSHPGLALMYSSIIISLLMSFIQATAARALVRRWQKRSLATAAAAALAGSTSTGTGSEITQPLLGITKTEEGEGDKDCETEVSGETRHATIGALVLLSTPDSPLLLIAFTAGAVAALCQALIPYYAGRIVDFASIDPDREAFVHTTQKLLAVAAACGVFTGIRGGLFTIAMTRLNVRLRTRLFHSLLHQDVGFYDTTRTGDITSRLSADTTTVSDQICLNLNVMLRSATQAAMVLGFMFSKSWRLTVVTFVMVPVVLAICKVYGGFYRKMSKKVQSVLAEANSVAEEAIGTMTTVKAHAAEGSTEAAYTGKLEKFYTLQLKEAAAYAAYMAINTFLSSAVVAGVLFYGGSLVLAGTMSAGSLVSFMLYQSSLSGAFQSLGDVFSALSAAVGAADKVIELMNRPPAFMSEGTLAPREFTGQLELRDVNFHYPSRPTAQVLNSFSLSIQPGEVVALVGPSGGGKSSIVKLVERFYLPTAGAVLIDGRDAGLYEPGWLRRHVALVSQEPVLYARSIRRNILYGMEREDGVPEDEVPTQEDIEAAARLANAHDFICALPEGYETDAGERGVQLSGGQKQRLAIARALVRKPAVLLLDEATSALDADSEAVVQEALDRTMAGRTVLVIAHRLSTVQGASRIVVVQGGCVAESGTHDELLAANGAYASLVRRQLARTPSVMSLENSMER